VQEKKGISVIIPNYNGVQLLPEILPFLEVALQNSHLLYEIILCDDCSTDDSIFYVQQNYPTIAILKNDENLGFSKTINKGIFKASLDYVLLLNSDVKLTANYFEKLIPYFDKEDTFGVMGRIVGWDDEAIQDGGKYPSFHGVKIKTSGNYIPINSQEGDRLFSMYLSGANALVSRKKILLLGGFDEIFSPFYVEDFELSLRAWRLGWKCYYEHNAICKHKTSTTIKNKSSKTFIKTIYNRNKMLLHAIHLSQVNLFFWYVQLFAELLLQIFTGKIWFLKAVKMFLNKSSLIKNSRNKFLHLSKKEEKLLSVKEVTNLITTSLKHMPIKKFS
jgi:GT2 family glycosyltransferase